MGRERQRRPLSSINEIQMTSLMDLSFLLLITFIITYPMLEQGIRIKLPRGKAESIDQLKSHNITIDAQGNLYHNHAATTMAELEQALFELVSQEPQTPVLVRADERLEYGQIVKVLRLLNRTKVTRMALVTDPD